MNELLSFTGSPWLDVLLSALFAVGLALAAHTIGAAILARILRFHDVGALVVRHTRAPARWVVVFAALNLVWVGAAATLPALSALEHATAIALIAAVTWLALGFVDALVAIIAHFNPFDVEDNLHARRIRTQARVLGRTLKVVATIFGIGAALVTFPGVRQFGATLLASAGMAGLVAGLAARPVLGNIIAGLQIALTQPIRIDDVLIVEGEWGRVEEITGAFVVVKVWDERRLVVPLQWFIEHPFQNWTRSSSQIIGTVYLWVDYGVPVERVREEFLRICREAPEWEGRVAGLQVTDLGERAMQLRGIASSLDAGRSWDLRCRLREALVSFIQREFPQHFPRARAELEMMEDDARPAPKASAKRPVRA